MRPQLMVHTMNQTIANDGPLRLSGMKSMSKIKWQWQVNYTL